jgi:hypothetical protein
MAKAELNALLAALHGTIGDLVLVREGDNIYVRHRARQTAPRSQAQVAQNQRMTLASRWARTLLADPAMKAAYERGRQGHLSALNVAVRDFLNAPVIEAISLDGYRGRPGDLIRIRARDDFRIVRLSVQIRTVEGVVLEEGEALWEGMDGAWGYRSQIQVLPQTTVLIEATALDLPGNRTTAQSYYWVGGGAVGSLKIGY